MPIGDERRVAIHEAGHAVALFEVCGIVPAHLSLQIESETLGGMRPFPPMDHLPETASNESELQGFIAPMMVFYAGAVAVSLFADRLYPDEEDEVGFDAGFDCGQKSDAHWIHSLAWRAAGGENGTGDSEAIRELACSQTRVLLKKRKSAIWSVASRLLKDRVLTSVEVEPLLRPAPEPGAEA